MFIPLMSAQDLWDTKIFTICTLSYILSYEHSSCQSWISQISCSDNSTPHTLSEQDR